MSYNYLKLLYELIKMLKYVYFNQIRTPSISAMHQTSCQPSAKEAIFLLVFVFLSASSITQKCIYGFQWIFTYFYFITSFLYSNVLLYYLYYRIYNCLGVCFIIGLIQ